MSFNTFHPTEPALALWQNSTMADENESGPQILSNLVLFGIPETPDIHYQSTPLHEQSQSLYDWNPTLYHLQLQDSAGCSIGNDWEKYIRQSDPSSNYAIQPPSNSPASTARMETFVVPPESNEAQGRIPKSNPRPALGCRRDPPHAPRVPGTGGIKLDCPFHNCQRAGANGFTRKDNLVQHRRNVHGEDIPRARGRLPGRGTTRGLPARSSAPTTPTETPQVWTGSVPTEEQHVRAPPTAAGQSNCNSLDLLTDNS